MGVSPIEKLDTPVPDKGPYPVTIRYLQRVSKPISGIVLSYGGYPINEAVSRGKSHHRNMERTLQRKTTRGSFAHRFR